MRNGLGCRMRILAAAWVTVGGATAWAQEVTEPLSPAQRQGLIDFYNALDGDHWVNNSGWKNALGDFNPPGTEDTWHGVDVGWIGESMPGEPPSVTHLAMSDNHLNGSIDDLLQPFPELVSAVFLWELGLTGQIPDLWGREHLRTLAFVECGINGSLPTRNGQVVMPPLLQSLSLGGCPLSLDWGQLQAMPCAGHLTALDLQGIPLNSTLLDFRVDFPSLTILDLENTGSLGFLPEGLPVNLSQLDLSNNNLTGGIPDNWGTASELLLLFLQGNRLSGELPASLQNLTGLAPGGGLNLDWNALSTTDPDVWSFLLDKHHPVTLPDGTFLGDWRERQTTAPAQTSAWPTGDGRLHITWTAAPNAWQDGCYLVEENVDGINWTPVSRTPDRTVQEAFIPLDERRLHHHFRVSTVSRPFTFNTNEVVSQPLAGRYTAALLFDDFESPLAWQLSGDFATGAPQPGNGASMAYSGAGLLGSNLAGMHLDNQVPGMSAAISPPINCVGKSHVKLAFRSFSQFDGFSGDLGTVDVAVDGGPWHTVETLGDYAEQGWERHWVDLSPWADNQADVRVRFAYTSDNSFALDGWNLDDVLVVAHTPVSGIYTVDPAGTQANNFTTLGAAVDFINARDLVGPVLFNVVHETVFEEELDPLFVKGAADRPLTFANAGPGTNPILRSQGGEGLLDGVLRLRGAHFVRITGLDLEPGPQVEHGLQLLNRSPDDGCSDIVVSDLAIRGGRLAGAAASTRFMPVAESGSNSRITLERVAVSGAPTGLSFDNNWNTGHMDLDNQVLDCVLLGAEGAEWGRGVWAQGQNGLRVERCGIRDLQGFIVSGVDLAGANLHVAGNRIHSLDGGWRVTGIQAEGAKVYNNMVSLEDDSEGAEIVGIALKDGYNSWCDFNSVRVRGGTQSSSDCLVLPESTSARVSNNILANLTDGQAEGWHHAAISVPGTPYFTSTASLCDANLVHVPSTQQGGVGFDRYIQQPLTDLATWSAATGADQLSRGGDPLFVSATDLHLQVGQSTPAEAAGVWLMGSQNYPWITTDLDGEARHPSTPDVGADEGDFANLAELPWEPYALSPQPGESDVTLRPELRVSWSWDNTHPVLWTEFYLGTDSLAVAACDESTRVLADGSAQSSWTPAAPLVESTRHYWQVRTCNGSGCTPGGVWSFTTEGVVRDFPFCETFDTQVPPAGWKGRLNQSFDGGLNGDNLQPTWGMGWFLTNEDEYVHSGTGAAQIHSWMMPAYYWLISPVLDLPTGGTAGFHLRFEHSEFQPTELHLLGDTGAGWSVLRSWNEPTDACWLEAEQQVVLPASGTLRLAFVYNAAASGSPVSLDGLCVDGGVLDAPHLEIVTAGAGLVRLQWSEVAGATGYKVWGAPGLSGPWSLLAQTSESPRELELPVAAPAQLFRVTAQH